MVQPQKGEIGCPWNLNHRNCVIILVHIIHATVKMEKWGWKIKLSSINFKDQRNFFIHSNCGRTKSKKINFSHEYSPHIMIFGFSIGSRLDRIEWMDTQYFKLYQVFNFFFTLKWSIRPSFTIDFSRLLLSSLNFRYLLWEFSWKKRRNRESAL